MHWLLITCTLALSDQRERRSEARPQFAVASEAAALAGDVSGMILNTKWYFGGCPYCGDCSGNYLNVERMSWYRCDIHRTKWTPGPDVFSTWRGEDPERWVENAKLLENYRHVVPLPVADI